MPENLYGYLNEHYTRRDELTDARILDEDTFSLVFIEEDEVKMTAVLNVRDVEGYYRLGTFTFSNSAKYAGKAFFSFENSALYRVEVVMHNTNVREFVERYGERLYPECGEHSNVLNLLGMSDFRLAMFLDSVDRLIYFCNKRTREKISLVELASGI